MLKSISAAAIALSLIAAPAFAQGNASPAAPSVAAPAKPVVHEVHKAKKHVAHKHAIKKHTAKAPAKLKTVKVTKTLKPKAI